MKIAVVDYGLGNLFSISRALEAVKANYLITANPSEIIKADKLLIPGVGAFSDGMKGLRERKLIQPIKAAVKQGKLVLGVCLGMQLLMESSEEFGHHQGLGLIPGTVTRINTGEKLPQIGWNQVMIIKTDPLLKGIDNQDWFYFVHSFVVRPKQNKVQLGLTDYGKDVFCSVIEYNHVYGVQFHPEKSGKIGLKLYDNFKQIR